MRKFVIILFATILASGCSNDYEKLIVADDTPVAVTLNIRKQENPNSRATNAMGPEKENLINDIWVLQYNWMGELTSAQGVDARQHLRVGEPGAMEVLGLEVALRPMETDCTVCLVANLGTDPLGNNATWPDQLEAFKKLTIPIEHLVVPSGDAKEGHVDRIGLFGYYQGPVTGNMVMNVSMGRLITRVRLNIRPDHMMAGPVNLKMENVRKRINIFPTDYPYQPSGNTDEEIAADKDANFTSFTETINNVGVGGAVRYYYMGENINPSIDYATKLTVSHENGTYTTYLGSDSPESGDPTSRNLSLERNSGYNFGINLKVPFIREYDLPKNGTLPASDYNGVSRTPSRLVDGNTTNANYANLTANTNTYFIMDLTTPKAFNYIKIRWWNTTNMIYRFSQVKISGSNDKSNFVDLEYVDIPTSGTDVMAYLKNKYTYRYVRIQLSAMSNTTTAKRVVEVYMGETQYNY